ncbi:MAG: CapA family protein [Melioribacter sp.]|nr:CapA family protein [Melioribacter sp.]
MKSICKFFLSLLLLLFIQGSQKEPSEISYSKNEDSTITVKLSFVGDIMCHTPQIEYAKIGSDSFNFLPTFKMVQQYLSDSDLTFGNLETVIAGKSEKYTGYPLFNSPEELLDALKFSGFDILFTSNNHSLDRGAKGVERTIRQIENRNLINSGTYLSQHSRVSLLVVEKNGLKLGILSYTYGLNGNFLPKSKKYLVNVIDTSIIKKDVTAMTKKNVDLILVYYHFGDEYSRLPSKYQEEIVSKTFNYGADIIIGSHPHVIQPVRFIEKSNGKLKKGFVAYSLGNFISNQRWRYSDAGVILNLEIKHNTANGSTWVSEVKAIPTWVFKGRIDNKNQFVILPSDTTALALIPEYLGKEDIEKLLESYNDTMEILFKK